MSKIFSQVCESMKVKQTFTPAYNPKSNPAEQSHSEIKAALLALTLQLMFVRNQLKDLDAIFPSPTHQQEWMTMASYMKDMQTRLHQPFHLARHHMGPAKAADYSKP